ncbi:MAG: glycosyltransferase family 2 protein [Candidatus Tantalella remota]|nr:glycosyltransferase family 2 protein [Candidatus Tantalella remota]
MLLSIVIPAYNEEKRITRTLDRVYDFMKEKDYDYEVIVVDDGSSDDTLIKVAESCFSADNRLRVIRNGENRGKGFSVKKGVLGSKGEYVLFSDADMSTPIEEVDKLFEVIKEGYDIAIGSRSISGSDVKVRQPWYREKMGRVFNCFVRLFLLSGFNDTQCGFKLFKGDVIRSIAEDLKIDGFCFDVEILYLVGKKKYGIKEVGIVWNDSPDTRVQVLGSSLDMFLDLLRIGRLHR